MTEPEPVVIILITFPTDGDVTAFAMALVGDGAAAADLAPLERGVQPEARGLTARGPVLSRRGGALTELVVQRGDRHEVLRIVLVRRRA